MATPQPPATCTPMLTSQPTLPLPAFLQENELSQDCKDLMLSLPVESGWIAKHIYQYQGFWLTSQLLQALLVCQNHFQAQNTDIILATNPKSGTTWLLAVVFALLNRGQLPDTKQHPLLTNNPHVLVPSLEFQYRDKHFPDFTNLTSPRLFSTHLSFESLPQPMKDKECKIIYLCRDPKDTFVSFWHFVNKMRPKELDDIPLEDAFDRFCRGASLFGPFWDHVLSYWKESLENPKRLLFLRYEEMKKDPRFQLKRISEFIGCPFSLEEETNGVVDEILKLCSFDHLSNLEVNKTGNLPSGQTNQVFFRRGKIGDSLNYLTTEMIKRIDEITEQKFQGCGLNL